MPKYLLSPQAQQSLLQISHYTLNNYGQQQKKKYLKKAHIEIIDVLHQSMEPKLSI